jgi:hypothetical protein
VTRGRLESQLVGDAGCVDHGQARLYAHTMFDRAALRLVVTACAYAALVSSVASPTEASPGLQGSQLVALGDAVTPTSTRVETSDYPAQSVGFVVGAHSGAGLMYRHFLGPYHVQASVLGHIIRDQDSLFWAGLSAGRHLLTWQRQGMGYSVLPNVVGVRFVVGTSYMYRRTSRTGFGTVDNKFVETLEHTVDQVHLAGAGLGLVLGQGWRQGMAVALDVTLTGAVINGKLEWILPVPSLELAYNW